MKKYLNLFVFVLLAILVVIFTNGFLNTYFQQDEWHGFGLVISFSNLPIWSWFTIISGQHYFPFSLIFWSWLFHLFGFNASLYAIVSIFLHVFASFLVFVFIKKLSKNIYVAIISSILFALNARADQAFLHLAVFSSTITSFIFIITLFYYLLHILDKPRYKLIDFIIISLLFLSAVHFREDGLFLIPLVPIFIFLFSRKNFNKKNINFMIGLAITAILFLLFRVLLQFADVGSTSDTNPNIVSFEYVRIFFVNALTFPIKILVENLIEGHNTLFLLVDKYKSFFYPNNISLDISFTVLLDFVFLVVINLIIIIFYALKLLVKNIQFYKFLTFSLLGIFFYALLLSTVGRTMNIVEPRYLYFTGFLVMSIMGWLLVEVFNSKLKYLNSLKNLTVVVFIFTYIIYSYTNTQNRIEKLKKESFIREGLISQILKIYPSIPKKTIFFVKCKQTCTRNSEFGLSNNLVLPFSSGPGWIILLQYAKNNEQAYSHFFRTYNKNQIIWDWRTGKFRYALVNEFLWDMGAQGYRQIGDYGFGYFISMDLLKEDLKKNKLNKDIVIGLEYDDKNFKIKDYSQEIINQL